MKRPFKKDLERAELLIEEAKSKLREAMALVTDDTKGQIEDIIDNAFDDILISVSSDQNDESWDVEEGEDVDQD